jgi:cytochrome c oxidase cbb3-type subunit 3
MGGRLFANNCSTCHGSDARGGDGYPNLTDDDWLYGGAPETIVQTITQGRNGMMPPLGAVIGGEPGIEQVAQYVLSLSGRSHDAELAEQGKVHFTTICAVCHRPDGTGNPAMGAPNLTNGIWLHGGRVTDIEDRVRNGKNSMMPAHEEILEPEKIHLLALYVYSLSNSPGSGD